MKTKTKKAKAARPSKAPVIKLTPAMRNMMISIRDTGDAGSHLRGNSQHGGSGQTSDALRRARYVTFGLNSSAKDTLTPAGITALGADAGTPAKPGGSEFALEATPAKDPPKPSTAPLATAKDAAPLPPVSIRKEERELPLGAIVPSPENRSVTPDSLEADFLDSLRTWGILQPLWIYPLPADDKRRKGGALYELIAGERRWCGGGLLGLKLAPTIIFHCTAEQADELRLIENLQRKNLTELEEGRSFLRLMDKHGFAVRDDQHPERSIHHLINQSESYIFGRIKLVQSPKIVQEAVAAGTLNGSVALRVARLSDPVAQIKAVKEFANYERYQGEALTDKRAAELIEKNYQRQLKGAPFETRDAALVPVELGEKKVRVAGGACDDCPMRSGNQPRDLLPAEIAKAPKRQSAKSSRGDMCLNPACYQRKVDAAWAQQTRGFAGVVLSDEDSRAIFTGYLRDGADCIGSNCRYVLPSDKCAEDPKKRPFSELLGQPHPASVTRFLVRSHRTGKAHTLFLRAECKSAIGAGGKHTFYEKQSEKKREGNADTLIQQRETAIFEEAVEWRLAWLIDQLAAAPSGFDVNAYPFVVEALQADTYGAPSLTPAVLARWTPLHGGNCSRELGPAFVGTLEANHAQAFIAELALRRLIDHGSHRRLEESINAIAKACDLDVAGAWNKYRQRLAMLRKAGEMLTIAADFGQLQRIHAARGPERLAAGRPVLSFQYQARHYANLDADAGHARDCWEMVPVKAYDGKTHFLGKDDHGNEGLVVKQQGIEYALCGPRRHFFQRKEQCAKCGAVHDFTGKQPLTWANDEHTLCTACDGKGSGVGKAASLTAKIKAKGGKLTPADRAKLVAAMKARWAARKSSKPAAKS